MLYKNTKICVDEILPIYTKNFMILLQGNSNP
jgi:hypothetical protein